MHHAAKHTPEEASVVDALGRAFETSGLSLAGRLQAFPRHVRRQDLARFLVKHELFRLALPVNGSIVEGGVFAGGGLLTWAHLSAIYEPYNHTRRVIGFDSFAGFPRLDPKDTAHGASEHLQAGALGSHGAIVAEIEQLVAIHDRNRPLGHIPKVELVAGDAAETIPRYVAEHPHLLLGLVYLDFDLYEPTRVALEHLYPRVVAGGIVAFDELNSPEFPGETTALLETLGAGRAPLRRFPIDPHISYLVKG
jgi:hypothetical protein